MDEDEEHPLRLCQILKEKYETLSVAKSDGTTDSIVATCLLIEEEITPLHECTLEIKRRSNKAAGGLAILLDETMSLKQTCSGINGNDDPTDGFKALLTNTLLPTIADLCSLFEFLLRPKSLVHSTILETGKVSPPDLKTSITTKNRKMLVPKTRSGNEHRLLPFALPKVGKAEVRTVTQVRTLARKSVIKGHHITTTKATTVGVAGSKANIVASVHDDDVGNLRTPTEHTDDCVSSLPVAATSDDRRKGDKVGDPNVGPNDRIAANDGMKRPSSTSTTKPPRKPKKGGKTLIGRSRTTAAMPTETKKTSYTPKKKKQKTEGNQHDAGGYDQNRVKDDSGGATGSVVDMVEKDISHATTVPDKGVMAIYSPDRELPFYLVVPENSMTPSTSCVGKRLTMSNPNDDVDKICWSCSVQDAERAMWDGSRVVSSNVVLSPDGTVVPLSLFELIVSIVEKFTPIDNLNEITNTVENLLSRTSAEWKNRVAVFASEDNEDTESRINYVHYIVGVLEREYKKRASRSA